MHPIEDTLEAHLQRHAAAGSPVYIALIGLVLIGLGALPLVRVPVSIQSAGMIRPVLETHEVYSRTGGIVEAIRVRSNQNVSAGAEIVRLLDRPLLSELDALEESLIELQREMSDLQLLFTSSSAGTPPRRRSGCGPGGGGCRPPGSGWC